MAVGFDNTQDPRKIAQNNRALAQQRGDELNQQNADLGQAGADRASEYKGFLDPITEQMASGEGGYTPEEAAAINGQAGPHGLDGLPTSQDQLQSNFLSDDEQAGIKGNTGSYTDYFDPSKMEGNLHGAQGGQDRAVSDLQSGLHGAIDQDALKQSDAFKQDSENQIDKNQGQFHTTLNSEATNVRGAIDPTALRQDSTAAETEVMSPEEQQRMVTDAGISAGVRNQAAVGSLERKGAAAGMSPMGVAAYRARMNQETAAEAGDAMTHARVAAQQAKAGEALSSEQQREGAQQHLSDLQSGTEMDMGKQAVAGEEQLGQQALNQRNTTEGQRVADEQYRTGANLQAATTGGEAGLQNAETKTQQGQQQQQYDATTGTGIRQAQDLANSGRAATIAGNRQATAEGNQNTQFTQGKAVNDTASARAKAVADQRLGKQDTGLALQSGQQQLQNNNSQGAYGRQQQNFATQTGATNAAGGLAESASQNPGFLDKLGGAVTGIATGFAQGAGSTAHLADGGVATEPTLAVVGEHGPERIVPMGNPYRARAARAAVPKRTGRRVYGEAAA